MRELNFSGRPYFNLYGGQYTFMVNFELLCDWAKAEGFSSIEKDYQHYYVGKHLKDKVISLVELLQSHHKVQTMDFWDRDILMLKTLNALNKVYKSNYHYRMKYSSMDGTPSNQRQQIKELTDKLSANGVPDTVAYISEKEVMQVSVDLSKLGYREQEYSSLFQKPTEPISFVVMNLR